MDWLEYYIDELEYAEKDLKESYSELMHHLNEVVVAKDRMKEYPSEYYFVATCYQEASCAMFEIDYIQYKLIDVDKLRDRIREEIKRKPFLNNTILRSWVSHLASFFHIA